MRPVPWAGPLLRRPWRRLRGRLAPVAVDHHESSWPMARRVAFFCLVLFGAWLGTEAMVEVLPAHGEGAVEIALLVLFAVLFGWISAGFWTGLMGVFVLLRGPGHGPLAHGLAEARLRPLDPRARTAIIMPICNEDVPTVFGGLEATIESLYATGESANFDVYVLSDSSDPDIRAAEQAAWSDLASRRAAVLPDGVAGLRVHYRWRQRRSKSKAGNVADFCRRWGSGYRYFVVLDADSVMSGECLTSLVRLMEAHPDAGIIQTAPRPVGHETLHARIQQFCGRAYGPLFTAGMCFWQLGESQYWGHNAILRTAPFIEHCALAPIEGNGSLSGEILSHDFVEAALMRRAGWKVWVADELDGSYEQVPPNLLAELQRDRRWCQGNLQNSRLMFEPAIHAVHRSGFLTGVLAYASSPLWLVFLVLSTLLFARHAGHDPVYFFAAGQLFPSWPTANLKLMLTLFGLTAILLLAPKALSLLAIVLRGDAGRFGGTSRLLASAAIEFLHSLLLAPVRMLFHSQFVIAAITGWKLDWKSPPRDDAATGWAEAWRRHGVHTWLTLAWICAIVAGSDAMAWWLTPILLGLLGAAPLSVWGSRTRPGKALRRRDLLLTPEELACPAVLARAMGRGEEVARRLVSFRAAMVSDVDARRCLAGNAPAGVPRGMKGLAESLRMERASREGPGTLSDDERMRLLSSSLAAHRLREDVLARRAHPAWSAPRPSSSRAVPAPAELGDALGALLPGAGD